MLSRACRCAVLHLAGFATATCTCTNHCLLTAPKAFVLKKVARPTTRARSPFSKDRQYDLPGGDGFTVHKSDKPPTQFEDFDRLDRTWNVSDARFCLFLRRVAAVHLIA